MCTCVADPESSPPAHLTLGSTTWRDWISPTRNMLRSSGGRELYQGGSQQQTQGLGSLNAGHGFIQGWV